MIAWFAKNSIAANFLMIGIILVGFWSAFERVETEVEPGISFGQVWVKFQVPGGTPEDIEKQILIPCEQALEDLDNKIKISSSATSGVGNISVEAKDGTDLQQMRDEIAARIDSVQSIPDEAERPTYFIPNTAKWKEVITVVVSGELTSRELLSAAREVRDGLAALPEISKADIANDTDQEISIEIDPQRLRDYGISVTQLNEAIRRSSLDLSAGSVRTDSGNLLLRTTGQAYTAEDFAKIPIARSGGSEILLGEVATVTDQFAEQMKRLRFNGKPSYLIEITRTGNENAIAIADAVHAYVDKAQLPEGVYLSAWDDESVGLKGRFHLLSSSLLQGMILVFIILGLFLRPSLAMWIVIGIPISFAGALIFMPPLGVTANVMSLFGFIIVLGIVVDDAIVTGEHIFTKLKSGMDPEKAVITGTQEIATPVTFGVLTTMVAFIPLAFVPGWWGNYSRQIPLVVIPVLFFSLIESKLILPAHLKHLKVNRDATGINWFAKVQKAISDGLMSFVERVYKPSLKIAVNYRYATLALFLAIAAATVGYGLSGKMGMETVPKVDRYIMVASIRMQGGTNLDRTDEVVKRVTDAIEPLRQQFIDPGTGKSLIGSVLTSTGGRPWRNSYDEDEGYVMLEITPPSLRSEPGPKNQVIADAWEKAVGKIEGAREFRIRAEDSGARHGQDRQSISLEVRGSSDQYRPKAAEEIADLFRGHPNIESAWSSRERSQEELSFELKPIAIELGLTQRDLAQQIRQAFFGAEAQRVQRGIDEVRVMIRLPELERQNLHTLETLRINLPDGGTTSLINVAKITRAPAARRIERLDGSRYLNVGALPAADDVNINRLATDIEGSIDAICGKYPGVTWRYTGLVQENRETSRSTIVSSILLIFALYALLAIPFKSMLQPFFVLIAIPFGVVGALLGHLALDITPSYLSFFGLLALAGVVVNDSLVMVDFTNQKRRAGASPYAAVIDSGSARFRPILLTSLTTFAGLTPLMFDTAIHAQFLIPMAVSLGFGILFATVITLYLIPCCYLALEDLLAASRKLWNWYRKPFSNDEPNS